MNPERIYTKEDMSRWFERGKREAREEIQQKLRDLLDVPSNESLGRLSDIVHGTED